MKTHSIFKNKNLGIVLSGGGIKGMAHIGVLKALNEHEVFPDFVSGASSGALVGALYANGVNFDEMLHFFKETPLFKYNFFTLNKPGLFDTEKYAKYLQSYFPEDDFKGLNLHLSVSITNLQSGEYEIVSQGELIKILLASAALPPVFSPVTINGQLYADGGIMNNFPAEPLFKMCDYVFGCCTTSLRFLDKKELKNSYQLSQRATILMMHASIEQKFKNINYLFLPQSLDKIGVLDKKAIEKAFTIGYEYASKQLEISSFK